MRKPLPLIILIVSLVCFISGSIWANEDPITKYIMQVGDYFDVSYDEVNTIAGGNISTEEIPVVFLLAQLSGKTPGEVLTSFEQGMTWAEFVKNNKIHPAHLFVKVVNCNNKEYKKILEKFHNKPMRSVKLEDFDIICLVNYKFLSKSNKINVSQIINKRLGRFASEVSFIEINQEIQKIKRNEEMKRELARVEAKHKN